MVIGIVAAWNAQPSEAQADVVIRPDVSGTLSFQLEGSPHLVASGYRAAMEAMPAIRRELGNGGGAGE